MIGREREKERKRGGRREEREERVTNSVPTILSVTFEEIYRVGREVVYTFS